MGNPNSIRARRRLRGKLDADPNMICFMGRWMVRKYTVERARLGNGITIETSSETWHEPHVAFSQWSNVVDFKEPSVPG